MKSLLLREVATCHANSSHRILFSEFHTDNFVPLWKSQDHHQCQCHFHRESVIYAQWKVGRSELILRSYSLSLHMWIPEIILWVLAYSYPVLPMHVHVYIRLLLCVYIILLSVCDYIRLSVCLYVRIDETVYVYIRLNVCVHIRLCMCVHIDSMYECVFMCKTVSTCVLYKAVNEHACVCTCIHMFGFTYNV